MTSWALAKSGINAGAIKPATGGRAPGWDAGVVAALRPTHDTLIST